MNCPKCGNILEEEMKFCPSCGIPLEENAQKEPSAGVNTPLPPIGIPIPPPIGIPTPPAVVNDVSKSVPDVSDIPQINSTSAGDSNNDSLGVPIGALPTPRAKKRKIYLIGIVAVMVLGVLGGIYKITNTIPKVDNRATGKSVEVREPLKKEERAPALVPAQAPAVSGVSSRDDDSAKLAVAGRKVREMGFDLPVTSTSYGNSAHGFMAIVGGAVMLFDTDHNRAATLENIGALMQFQNQINRRETGPVVAKFMVWNDSNDSDSNAGWWEGTKHHIPIYMLWKYDEKGNVADNGLFTGSGKTPSHYQVYLYEQKNCDMAHIFMTEAIPLIVNANKHGALK